MNEKIVEMEASAHQKVQKLLPWLLAESLNGAELDLVRKHLSACAECREDLEWQRDVQMARPPIQATPDVERAFAALSAQLERPARPAPSVPPTLAWLRAFWSSSGQWQRWTMAAQGAAIAALALALLKPAGEGPMPGLYRALSAAPPTAAVHAGNAMVIFKPETTEMELRRILQASGARIVDGPTVTDAYLLYLPPDQRSAAVAALRREHAVALAELLDAGARR